MKTKVFAVYDSKASCFGVPFFMGTVGLAVRAFTELVNDPKSSPNRFPMDFGLFQIGEFDDIKGVLEPLACNINLGLASEFKRELPQTPFLPGVVEGVKNEVKEK